MGGERGQEPKKPNVLLNVVAIAGVLTVLLCIAVALSVSIAGQSSWAERSAIAVARASTSPAPAAPSVTEEPTVPVATRTLSPTRVRPTRTPAPTLEPTPEPGIGQEIVVEGMQWRVEEAINAGDRIESDNQFTEPVTTPGTFVRVRVALLNTTNEPESVSTRDFEIIDSQQRTFRASDDFNLAVVIGSENRCGYEELPPGVPKVCSLVFEVPKDASGFRLKATNLALVFTEEVLISLGL